MSIQSKTISEYTSKIQTLVDQMTDARKKANAIEDAHKRALHTIKSEIIL